MTLDTLFTLFGASIAGAVLLVAALAYCVYILVRYIDRENERRSAYDNVDYDGEAE